MTPGKINKDEAITQWQQLVEAYNKLQVTVIVIDQQKGNPDMVFATDEALVFGKNILLSRFWCKERRMESTYYEEWFRKNGYTITYLPNDVYFEGNGDSFLWDEKLFIGVGFRADKNSCKAVEKLLDLEVIPLEIIDPKFFHLDVGCFPLNNETMFYYPTAFSNKSRKVLKKAVPNLLELTKEEAYGFCANSIVTDHYVIHQKGNNSFKNKLKELRYTSIEVDAGEFMKSGGGIHCLTNILEKE
jgi:N-dimethylarginine dimethylaminohydrolase